MTSKPSEAPGGMYATGTIVRSYRSAQTIPVSIVVTANHRGYFEFRLCANNNVKQDPVQDCFNRFISHIFGGSRGHVDLNNLALSKVFTDCGGFRVSLLLAHNCVTNVQRATSTANGSHLFPVHHPGNK